MRLRRVFSIIAAMVLLLSILSPALAHAAPEVVDASNVNIDNVSVAPDSLAGDGTVTLSFTASLDAIAVSSISGLRLMKGSTQLTLSPDDVELQPTGSGTQFTSRVPVQAAELGKPITLTLSWGGYSAAESKAFQITVDSAAAAEPKVSFTRKISKTSVSKGETVTLEYTVENTGSVNLTNLLVTDDGIDGMQQKRDSLTVGSSATFTYQYDVNADFTSEPKLTYQANGRPYSKTVAAKKVTLSSAELEAVLEASPSSVGMGDETTLICTLTNSGNVKLTGITIADSTLGSKLFSTASLEAGATKAFSKTVALTKTTKFKYTITAKDESGKKYTFKSNELEVKVSEAAAKYDLAVTASADVLQLATPGEVNFVITATNKATAPVANIRVVDQDGKTVKTLDTLNPGTKKIDYATTVDRNTSFKFYLVVNGEDGEYKVSSDPIDITVTNGASTATASPSAEPEDTTSVEPSPSDTAAAATPGTTANGLSATMVALFVVGALIVITLIVLVSMIAKERKQRGKRRPAR